MSIASRISTASLAMLLVGGPQLASTQEAASSRLSACYMPSTGLLYMIGLPGLPTECRSPDHFELHFVAMPPSVHDKATVQATSEDDPVAAGEPGTTPDHLPPGTITTPDLANGAVTSLKILNGTIAAADMAVGAVTSSRIRNGAVATSDLASAAVTSDKIADGTIDTRDLAQRSVSSSRIRYGAVRENHLADGAVTAAKLADPGWSLSGNVVAATDFIGTTNDMALRFRVWGDELFKIMPKGAAVFGGTLDVLGPIPVEGAGTRMMWYPRKAAFRAGHVTGDEWDNASIGRFSIAMGEDVTASGQWSTALGLEATASNTASTAIGFGTTASGGNSTAIGTETTASGFASTAMGDETTASGSNSTAMGTTASTNGKLGAFVYGDASTATVFEATTNHEFAARASGGVRFYTNSSLTAGVSIGAGAGAWASVSDRDRKEAFRDVDGEDALSKIARMPIQSWSYLSEDPSIRHLGPVAQDFYEAFGLGGSDTTITTTDIDGVNMLAVQALERRTAQLSEENGELRAETDALRAQLAEVSVLRERLAAVEGWMASGRR